MRTSNLYYDDYHDYMYPADNDVPPDIGTFMVSNSDSTTDKLMFIVISVGFG